MVAFVCLILFVSIASAAQWSLSLTDDYGDGWNGGTISLYVNGVTVLSEITLEDGYGPETHYFEVNNGDQITTLYIPGDWSEENSYTLYDYNGIPIASQGLDETEPESITEPIIAVVPAGLPGYPFDPGPPSGYIGLSTDGALYWSFGANTTHYDLWLGLAGAMQQVVSGANAYGDGLYIYSGLEPISNYTWRVVAYNNDVPINGPLWSFVTEPGPGDVLIGTGSEQESLPIDPDYNCNYSQSYYLASEIGSSGYINSISYCWDGLATNTYSNQWTIFMKNTPNSEFSDDGIWETNLRKVFEGSVICPASPGWITISLDHPFYYNGTSNLVIAVMENAAGYDYPYGQFMNTESSTYRSLQNVSDDWMDEMLLPEYGYPADYFPNIVLSITAGTMVEPAAPILMQPDSGTDEVIPGNVQFSWLPDLENGVMPESYNLYIVPSYLIPDVFTADNFFAGATCYTNVTSGFHLQENLQFTEVYYWTVEALVPGQDPAYTWPPHRFSTIMDNSITTFPYTQSFDALPLTGWNLQEGSFNWVREMDISGTYWACASFFWNPIGETAIMTSPMFSSPNPLQLSFDWSHTNIVWRPLDALTIQISDDLSNWTNIWHKSGMELESDDESGSYYMGRGVNERVSIPQSYLGYPFWLRFYAESGYGANLYIDNVVLAAPPEHDLRIKLYNFPELVSEGPFIPQISVTNLGASIESFNLNLQIGRVYSHTELVSNLAPDITTQISFPSFTGTHGSVYAVYTSAVLPSDLNPEDNVIQTDIACVNTGFRAYADRAMNFDGPEGPCTFMLSNPGEITDLPAANPWQDSFLSGADWINGEWFGYEYGVNRLWEVDTATGAGTQIGTGTTGLTGIAYDPDNGVIYASGANSLYTLDPLTGASTLVGSYGPGTFQMISLACRHIDYSLWAIDTMSDALYTIDPATGAATLVGPLGINISYAQDLAFNQVDGMLFLAAYTTKGALYWIDTETGAAFEIGIFEGGSELDGFVIPYGVLDAPELEISADGTLSWAPVFGAVSYTILSSTDPYNGFTYAGSTTETTWQDYGNPNFCKFYQVIATDYSLNKSLTKIRYEGDVYRGVQRALSSDPPTPGKYTRPQ